MDPKKIAGYAAGMAAGVSYGLNPLFGKPLLDGGVGVPTMLFFRYLISTCLLGPVKTAVLGVFEPVTAIFVGSVFFAEPLTATIVTGLCSAWRPSSS